MDQPLWQNWLNVALIAFVARRAGVTLALHWQSLSGFFRGIHCLVLVACVFAAFAVWFTTRWVIAALGVLALVFTIASLAEFTRVDSALRLAIAVQLVVAVAGAAVLIQLARRASSTSG